MKTTIQISKETKDLISTFGLKGESYEDIIKRLYEIASKERLRQFLMPSDKFISLDEARKRLEQEWPR